MHHSRAVRPLRGRRYRGCTGCVWNGACRVVGGENRKDNCLQVQTLPDLIDLMAPLYSRQPSRALLAPVLDAGIHFSTHNGGCCVEVNWRQFIHCCGAKWWAFVAKLLRQLTAGLRRGLKVDEFSITQARIEWHCSAVPLHVFATVTERRCYGSVRALGYIPLVKSRMVGQTTRDNLFHPTATHRAVCVSKQVSQCRNELAHCKWVLSTYQCLRYLRSRVKTWLAERRIWVPSREMIDILGSCCQHEPLTVSEAPKGNLKISAPPGYCGLDEEATVQASKERAGAHQLGTSSAGKHE